ncbi:type I secretion outer membrane protein, TolC family [Variovorax sp. SRS16]|uniref:TolC family protein n=1 Tax=Variovorax sp. SRS16 TaxID=282217 RepID=UPI001318F891|nr:TolC family protein [Variovorax sp. SRS16]VTU31385.1 type I secretion outer membrane protein, TolC family [Variovorax sp. SRS16]
MFIDSLSFRARSCPVQPRRLAVGIAVALVMGAGAAHAATDALTLDQALRLAENRSRTLVAQDATASAARDMAVAAGQRPDPTLKVGINNLPVNGADRFSLTRDFMTMRSVGVMQEFTREDKLKARSARFEREAEVAEAGRSLALANLQRDTAMAWLDRSYQERMRDVLVSQRDEARLQIEAADAAYRGGRGAQADVFSARSAVAQIDDRIEQTERQVATARTQLARWIGPAASDPLGTAPALETVRLNPQDLETQLAHHPEIAVMEKQEEVAQAEADIAQANRKTDVSVELMYSQRGPAYSNMVSLNVSIPLQWDQKNRQDRELTAKLAEVERKRAEREEATRAHVAEALAMLQEWHSDRDRLTRYDGSLLPLAAERMRASIAAYRGGAGSLTPVLEARRAEIDVRIERLRLEMEAARLWAQLNYLVPADHDMAAPRP